MDYISHTSTCHWHTPRRPATLYATRRPQAKEEAHSKLILRRTARLCCPDSRQLPPMAARRTHLARPTTILPSAPCRSRNGRRLLRHLGLRPKLQAADVDAKSRRTRARGSCVVNLSAVFSSLWLCGRSYIHRHDNGVAWLDRSH